MSEVLAPKAPEKNAIPIRGQHHKFMLIPIMPHNAEWIEAGPVTFGVEGRALGDGKGVIGERGATLHVFSADRSEEYARFDCFDKYPHYHYILNDLQHNVLWGYDPDVNGPMQAWAVSVVRARLPTILRRVGALALADALDAKPIDPAILDKLEPALARAYDRTLDVTDAEIREGEEWMRHWKEVHPQFNTVDY
jgi:hypothetical protein